MCVSFGFLGQAFSAQGVHFTSCYGCGCFVPRYSTDNVVLGCCKTAVGFSPWDAVRSSLPRGQFWYDSVIRRPKLVSCKNIRDDRHWVGKMQAEVIILDIERQLLWKNKALSFVSIALQPSGLQSCCWITFERTKLYLA